MTSPRAVWLALADPEASPRADRLAGRTGLLLCAAVLVAVVLSVDLVPTHEGSRHIAAVWIQEHPEQVGRSAFPVGFELHDPLTSNGFALLYRPLLRLTDWRTAYRVTVVGLVLSLFVGAWVLLRTLAPAHRQSWAWAPLLVPVALGWLYHAGFWPFYAATALGCFVVAAWAQPAHRAGVLRGVGVALGLLLVAFCHVAAAVIAGLAMVAVTLGRPTSGQARALLVLAAVGAPAALLVVGVTLGRAPTPLVTGPLEPFRLREPVSQVGSLLASGPWWRAWPPALLWAAAILWPLLRPRRLDADRVTRVALAAVGFAALWLLPTSLTRWEHFAVRFGPLPFVAALSLLPVPRRLGRRLLLGAAALAFAVSAAGWSVGLQRRAEQGCADVLALLARPTPAHSGLLQTVVMRSCSQPASAVEHPDLPYLNFAIHLGALLPVVRGGLTIGLHGDPVLHTYTVYRAPPEVNVPVHDFWLDTLDVLPTAQGEVRARLLAALAARVGQRAAVSDRLFLFGPEDFRQAVLATGVEPREVAGEAVIGTYRGCPATLALPDAASRVQVSWGWLPLTEPWHHTVASGSPPGPVPLPGAPCTSFWVRARGEGPPGACWACGPLDGAGRLVVAARAPSGVVPCQPVPVPCPP
ncbi:MAG: hypothetical protein RBU45_20690 [Myxococcota bacterium]|jgi:hypothetical protein|nr:hypothetical protein [Myxococcota bacterium]